MDSDPFHKIDFPNNSVVTFSTTKFDYMEAAHGSKDAIWFKIMCSSIAFVQKKLRVGCDISCVISLAKNPTYDPNTKNIVLQ